MIQALIEAALNENPLDLKNALAEALKPRIRCTISEMYEEVGNAADELTEEEQIEQIMESLLEAADVQDVELTEEELVALTEKVLMKRALGGAIAKSEAARQRNLKRAEKMVKNGFDHETAARNHDVSVAELKKHLGIPQR